MIMTFRVRYAPSPTGSPHVGNVRDALFKFLFANHHKGNFVLRIEDTDRTRYVPGCEEEIIESLEWLDIKWDEGFAKGGDHAPYRQSERKEIGVYQEWAQKLLDLGQAYKAFDTSEELAEMREYQQINKQPIGYFGGIWRDASYEQIEKALQENRPYVIRLKIPKNQNIVIEDAIRGRIEWDSNNVDDPVLIKADHMPTYHFAAMVDDHLMDITHIIRGEEWISSAPKHACLFDAFGWSRPIFVHCPLIHGKDGKKLSKRHGDTRCLDFRAAGYLPEALINFIALIGWAPGGDKEIMSLKELIEVFDIGGLQPSPGIFDMDKLKWMNGHYIRQSSSEKLIDLLAIYSSSEETYSYWKKEEHLGGCDLNKLALLNQFILEDRNYAQQVIELERERVHTLADFAEATSFFFEELPSLDPQAISKWMHYEHVPDLINSLENFLKEKTQISVEECEAFIRKYASDRKFEKISSIVHPIRITLTGKTVGPGLFELMHVLGPQRMLKRLNRIKELILN